MRPKPVGTLVHDALLPGKRLFLFATGTGLAPFASIVRDPETYEKFDQVVLTHTCRGVAELDFGHDLIDRIRGDAMLDEMVGDKLRYICTTTRETWPDMGRMTDWIRDGRLASRDRRSARSRHRPGDDLRLDGDAPGAQGALRGRGHDRGLERRARAVRDREGLRRLTAVPLHELAALGAATCWALTGIIAAEPAGHLGALVFNRWRQVFATGLFLLYVAATGVWRQLDGAVVGPLLLSGLLGIFVGNSLLFATLNRLGPRRTGVLFALNAPIAALIAWLALGETLAPRTVAGIALTVAGVGLAIVYGKRRAQLHQWEAVRGPLWLGIAVGLGAATGQALGSIIARPVMAGGLDPFAASLVRVGVAAACLTVLVQLPIPAARAKAPLTPRAAALTAAAAFLGLGVGMTLLLYGLAGGKVGIVSTLSATSPVIILPMLWARTGERPAAGAWAGAALVVAGMALIFLRGGI